MTFVAQPYEQFADDLLTALTGGVIREEHRYVESEPLYSLATPGAIPFSIRLFGQRNEAFFLFEGGRDYLYDPEESAITWADNGRRPDSQSYFYVNYYVQNAPRRLTDRNPGSVTTTLSEAFARELAVLHKQMEMIYESAFVDLATNSSLDHVAALLGLARKDARFATGEVLFKRSTPAPGDITIPAGTLVATAQGQNFETVERRTLRRGQLSVIAPIRAQLEGPPGRVEANAIQIINRPIFGIDAVVNEKATFFAVDKETDDAFRQRIKGTLERAGKATVSALKYGLIEALPEITEGNVQVSEPPDVPGRVEVKFGLTPPDDPEWLRRVEEAIFEARPAGIRVTHNLSTRTATPTAAQAAERANGIRAQARVTSFPPDVLAQMPDGRLPLQVDVALQLAEQNLSTSEKESIQDQVRQKVAAYIDGLPMGSDLIYNQLLGQVMQIEEVADATMLVDAATASSPQYAGNLVTDGRKAIAQSVTVGLMEETVQIRVAALLQPRPTASSPQPLPEAGATIDGAASAVTGVNLTGAGLQQALDRTREEIGRAVEGVLAQATVSLTRTALQGVIRTACESQGAFQLAPGAAVTLSAEYEETGRLLNNTETVDLASNQVPRLKALDVSLQEELDG